ncbi:MAG TPA: hypothetical protein VMU16_15950 [Candidatus Binataceae bacterium]|nr:hypothetical protein [Candidatus Binataceae bacterium]
MNQRTYEFRFSEEELEYIKGLVVSHNVSLDALYVPHEGQLGAKITIELSRQEAEQVRDILTEQLAMFGFDEKYRPNKEGQMCEDLIDKFFIR